jgi:hypothetical protein
MTITQGQDRTIVPMVFAFALLAAPANAQRAKSRQGVARQLELGSVLLLLGTEPQKIVPARPGRCVLILSGWGIQEDADPGNNIVGSPGSGRLERGPQSNGAGSALGVKWFTLGHALCAVFSSTNI